MCSQSTSNNEEEERESDEFDLEDELNPVYCRSCRRQVPRSVAAINNGFCAECAEEERNARQLEREQEQIKSKDSATGCWQVALYVAIALALTHLIIGILAQSGGVVGVGLLIWGGIAYGIYRYIEYKRQEHERLAKQELAKKQAVAQDEDLTEQQWEEDHDRKLLDRIYAGYPPEDEAFIAQTHERHGSNHGSGKLLVGPNPVYS